MQSSKEKEDKKEITVLRKEIYEWKQKYYNCQRKVNAQ